jgi:hypothetical protein
MVETKNQLTHNDLENTTQKKSSGNHFIASCKVLSLQVCGFKGLVIILAGVVNTSIGTKKGINCFQTWSGKPF